MPPPPRFELISNLTCPLCMVGLDRDAVEKGGDYTMIACGHVYHKTCYDKAQEQKGAEPLGCPACAEGAQEVQATAGLRAVLHVAHSA